MLTSQTMDTETDKSRPCYFCRNYTWAPASALTDGSPCESCPSVSCPSCVRLYEGRQVDPCPSSCCNVHSHPSVSRLYMAGTQMLSCWSHTLRHRWQRHWRGISVCNFESLDPPSFSRDKSSSSSSSSHSQFTLSTLASTYLMVLVLLLSASYAGACSSRSTPKPRPPSQSAMRPNITFQTYACPPAYAAWYCLNGATCFTVKIADSILYNCECADGYMGQRCEFKDLDGSYLPARERLIMGQNSNIGHAFLVVLLIVMAAIVASVIFTLKRTRSRKTRRKGGAPQQETGFDDGLDFVYGGNCSPSVLPPYNNNLPSVAANGSMIGLSTFGTTLGGQAAFCETIIGCAGTAGSKTPNDTSVLGQSISYTLSRQSNPRQTLAQDYYSNGVKRSTSRHSQQSNHRVPQACLRTSEQFT